MNINLLSLSNNKKSSHVCVKYGSEDVYTAGKSANCDLTQNWAQFISAAGQRLYTIQRRSLRRPISARNGTERRESRNGTKYSKLSNRPRSIRITVWNDSIQKAIHLYKLTTIYLKKYIINYTFSALEIRVKNEVVHRRIGQSGQIFKLSACPQVVRKLSDCSVGGRMKNVLATVAKTSEKF